jgi:hypothetical protein
MSDALPAAKDRTLVRANKLTAGSYLPGLRLATAQLGGTWNGVPSPWLRPPGRKVISYASEGAL